MRICRIIHMLPSNEQPGGGLVPYNLAKYIPEPTLYITRRVDGTRPISANVEVATLEFRDTTTPAALRPVSPSAYPTGLCPTPGVRRRASPVPSQTLSTCRRPYPGET